MYVRIRGSTSNYIFLSPPRRRERLLIPDVSSLSVNLARSPHGTDRVRKTSGKRRESLEVYIAHCSTVHTASVGGGVFRDHLLRRPRAKPFPPSLLSSPPMTLHDTTNDIGLSPGMRRLFFFFLEVCVLGESKVGGCFERPHKEEEVLKLGLWPEFLKKLT